MAEEKTRTLRLVFVGDVSEIDRQLDRIEQRAGRIGVGGGTGGFSVARGPLPAVGGPPSPLRDEPSDWRSAFASMRQGEDRVNRAKEREARAAERIAEVAERQAADAERLYRSVGSSGIAGSRGRSRGKGGLPPSIPLPAYEGGPSILNTISRRIAVGAVISGFREAAGVYTNRLNAQDAAQFQMPNEKVASLLAEAEAQNSGLAGMFYRANEWAVNNLPKWGTQLASWYYRNYNPLSAIRELRSAEQKDRAQQAEFGASSRVQVGGLQNQSLSAASFGDQYKAKLSEIEAGRESERFAAFQQWQALNHAHVPGAAATYKTLLGQADTHASLQAAIATRGRAAALSDAATRTYVAGLHASQRDDAEAIGQHLLNQGAEDLIGDDPLRGAMAAQHRSEEAAAWAEVLRKRDGRSWGYATTRRVAGAIRNRDPFEAQQAQAEEDRARAMRDAPAGEKMQAWDASSSKMRADFWEHYREVSSSQDQMAVRLKQMQFLLQGDRLGATLAGIAGAREEAIARIPSTQGGLFGPMYNYLRQQANAYYNSEEMLARKEDADKRWSQTQFLRDREKVTDFEAQGKDKTARAQQIMLDAERQAQAIRRAGGPNAQEDARLTIKTAINEEKTFLRQLQLEQYGGNNSRSGQGYGMGGIGAGNNNMKNGVESILKGIESVKAAIDQLRRF